MKYLNFTLIIILTLLVGKAYSQAADQDKKPALVFVENGAGDVSSGKIYASSVRGAARNGNGNDSTGEEHYRFGNIGDWSIDLVISRKIHPFMHSSRFGKWVSSCRASSK